MTPIAYFRCSLVAPVLFGLLLLPWGAAVLVFGGIQYVIFAIWIVNALYCLLTRTNVIRDSSSLMPVKA
jgi:hypothetical protein